MGVKEDRTVSLNKWRSIKNEEMEGDWVDMMMDFLNSVDKIHYAEMEAIAQEILNKIKIEKEELYVKLERCDPLETANIIQVTNNEIEQLSKECFYRFEKYAFKNSLVEKEN